MFYWKSNLLNETDKSSNMTKKLKYKSFIFIGHHILHSYISPSMQFYSFDYFSVILNNNK